MTTKRTRATAPTLPLGADNFRLIDGIGSAIAPQLYAAGINTFAQLAAMAPDEIIAQLGNPAGLSATRIAEEDWIGQARSRATQQVAEQAVTPPPQEPLDQPNINKEMVSALLVEEEVRRYRYTTFKVSLLLDADNSVRRTKVAYMQPKNGSEEEDNWPCWDSERLLRFIIEHSNLKLPQAEDETTPNVIVESESLAEALSVPHLRRLVLLLPPATEAQRIVPSEVPCRLELELDCTDLIASGVKPDRYTLTVRAKQLGSGTRQIMGLARGSFPNEPNLSIVASARSLSSGLYRLEADVELSADSSNLPYLTMTHLEGDLVYMG